MASNVFDNDFSEFEGFNPSDVGSDINVSDVSSESELSEASDISWRRK